jgi:acyl-CoA reductase-like NAD-dependent aldehyde dehydrogenase
MPLQLTKELSDALLSNDEDELEVVDPRTQQSYYLVPGATHRQAMDALRAAEDRAAIAEAIRQMEAGEGQPLEEAFDEIRAKLGLRARS